MTCIEQLHIKFRQIKSKSECLVAVTKRSDLLINFIFKNKTFQESFTLLTQYYVIID